MFRWCLVCVICNSYSFSFLYFQTLHNDCSHIENVHLPFFAHLINIFLFLTGVELRHFFHPKCVGVSGLCRPLFRQFSLFCIQTSHNDCSYIEHVHLLFCAHLLNIFLFLAGVELRHFFSAEMRRGSLVRVICNSDSFHSVVFKLCIIIIHTLNMCTSFFVNISWFIVFFLFLGS